MGKVKFLRGVESHYNATTHQDGIYFTTDDDNVNSIIMNGRKYGVPYVETTYSALKDLRDGGYLTPGAWYRITDYVTTTTQADTQSANHPFDVIVLATSTNTLSEEARAIQHSGDTYFANSNLSAWKIWYCLDNDTTRFAWADDSVDESIPASITINGVKYNRNPQEDELAGIHPYAWKADTAGKVFTNEEEPSGYPSKAYNNSTGGKGTKSYTIGFYTPGHEGTNLPNGRGVIYRLIDEWNNDCPYDFKNIMFQRKITDGSYATGGTNTWCYTLNVWHNNSCNDASVIGNTLINNEDYVVGVYKNKFGTCTEFDVYGDGVNTLKFRLGNNVVLTVDYGGEYYGCHSNTIGNSFYNNTIGDDFNDNTIGNGFCVNTIGNLFQNNTIGNGFGSNTIGNYFQNNTIGNDFRGNTIGTGTGSTVTTINYVRYIRVEDGVKYVNITTTATTSASAYLQNITISQGIAGVSDSNRKTITHPTVGDTFQTIYRPANSQVITV